mmetsp:Transcript_13876/g.21589  ORF Transcript_13876/g.21589 Transcript_13876/m.21589 type:complete len:236 (+) Transcript_13876:760-1467(+)
MEEELTTVDVIHDEIEFVGSLEGVMEIHKERMNQLLQHILFGLGVVGFVSFHNVLLIKDLHSVHCILALPLYQQHLSKATLSNNLQLIKVILGHLLFFRRSIGFGRGSRGFRSFFFGWLGSSRSSSSRRRATIRRRLSTTFNPVLFFLQGSDPIGTFFVRFSNQKIQTLICRNFETVLSLRVAVVLNLGTFQFHLTEDFVSWRFGIVDCAIFDHTVPLLPTLVIGVALNQITLHG